MEVRVIFTYDEAAGKWETTVTGTENEKDTRDAFAAVVASCHMIEVDLQQHALLKPVMTDTFNTGYVVTPAVL